MRFHIKADYVDVFVMRKAHAEFRNKLASLQFWIYQITQAGEKPTRSIARCDGNMAVRADCRGRPLTGKELRAMTLKTTGMFRKLRHIGKRGVALAHEIPVLRRHPMTRVARELLRHDVGGVRELRVVDLRFSTNFRLLGTAFLRALLRYRVVRRSHTPDAETCRHRRESDEDNRYESPLRHRHALFFGAKPQSGIMHIVQAKLKHRPAPSGARCSCCP